MTKHKLSSELVIARGLAIYQLDKLIECVRSIDPELKPHEATELTAYVLSNLPELFANNPQVVVQIKEVAIAIKRKHRNPESN